MKMRRPHKGALAIAVVIVALIVLAAVAFGRQRTAVEGRPEDQRPRLMLLTSLPLVFGDDFGLQNGGSAALSALEGRYTVVPINSADRRELSQGRLLLMAHPLAQTAEDLMESADASLRGVKSLGKNGALSPADHLVDRATV